MTTIRDIENAVRHLSPAELVEFRRWFAEFEAEARDKQLESDLQTGRLDSLADRAIEDLNRGRCKDL
jgi:hypothetical protein